MPYQIHRACRYHRARRIERNASYKVLVCLHCLHAAPRLQVPDLNGLVIRGTQQKLARGMEHKPSYPIVMADLNNIQVQPRCQ